MRLNINPRIKNFLWGIFAIVLVVVFVVWFIANPGPEHIEDTNGADNFSLQVITEQDIIEHSMGTRGAITEKESKLDLGVVKFSDGKEYSASKFTGVSCLYTSTIFEGSDIDISLAEYKINAGNFAFYVVFDGEVVGQIMPSDSATSDFRLENVNKTGTLEYIIAGESADFSFIVPTDFS